MYLEVLLAVYSFIIFEEGRYRCMYVFYFLVNSSYLVEICNRSSSFVEACMIIAAAAAGLTKAGQSRLFR